MGYKIEWFNANGNLIDFEVASKENKSIKYAEAKHKHAARIEIRQIRGNWKRIGEYLLGIRRPNGYIDWQRVPSDISKPSFEHNYTMEVRDYEFLSL